MKLVSHLKRAAVNLSRAKSRTFLAMLGIIVGTASVVALLSVGKLATEAALDQFKNLGINLIAISLESRAPQPSQVPITTETLADLPAQVSEINLMAPYVTTNLPGSLGPSSWDSTDIIGTTEEMAQILNIKMRQGRFISNLDKSQYFCVVGQKILEKMKVWSPLGEHIKLGPVIFTAIGVADTWPENGFFIDDINSSIIIPIKAINVLSKNNSIHNVMILLHPDSDLTQVKNKITQYFKDRIPDLTVNVRTAIELISGIKVQQGIFTLLLGVIGGISLLVGGIGVANIMLASVAERRYEIGLRLAIGAQPADIQVMFLMEAAVLGITGGLLGVFFGLLSTVVIAFFAGWNFSLFWFPPTVGFCISLLITLFFGFYPALIASKINPIEALRGT